ncbi:MAG: bifunctional phosphopantothenoylcysteine decarboxylase/phosphopantothenate--cysteine ligase CoaBC [Spirochaetales bacterium]|nr:bifunctional phosphopantothenoylcysteine decarboxylase/phosphopantothenate--cysteine ligase CoaBC [Spirochaetales bacterium]
MESLLHGKHITICVTGSIAAYKAASLASFLKKKKAEVHVILTKSASRFVSAVTFKSLTGNPVITKMFDASSFIPHISIAQLSDLVLVAPATANVIAKAANGIADDMVSATLLSSTAPKIIVPAMNTAMYENPITQQNLKKLADFGFEIIEPDCGEMACGSSGKGRFPEINQIYGKIIQVLSSKRTTALSGKKVLITAGGTIEDIDPVRFIGNRSSGRTAFAFAKAFIAMGAQVSIIAANVSERALDDFASTFTDSQIIKVRCAADMENAVNEHFKNCDLLFMCAAVADYKPNYSTHKIKKADDNLVLELSRTNDILCGINNFTNKIIVGFAAETDNVEEYARRKLEKKNLDFVIANKVCGEESAIGGEKSSLLLFSKGRSEPFVFPYAAKTENAFNVIEKISELLTERANGQFRRKADAAHIHE